MADEPGCLNCKYYRGNLTCDAYPELIPLPIQSGDVEHITPKPGDHGIQYEEGERVEEIPETTT